MNSLQEKVMAYHESIGAPIADGPIVLHGDVADAHYQSLVNAVMDWVNANDHALASGDLVPAYEAVLELVFLAVSLGVLSGFDIDPGFGVIWKQRMATTDQATTDPKVLLAALIEQQQEAGQVYRLSLEIADRIRRDQPLAIPEGTNARIVGQAWAGAGIILAKDVSDIAAHGRWKGMK